MTARSLETPAALPAVDLLPRPLCDLALNDFANEADPSSESQRM